MELGYAMPFDILIRRSANMGFIVKIGCGEFVAHNRIDLIDELDQYLKDPEKWAKEYNKKCRGDSDESDRAETEPMPQPILATNG